MVLPVQVRLGAPPLWRMIMSIDIHSEIEEARDTRIRLAAKIEVLEELLEEINNIKKAAEIVLEGISND